MTREQLEQKRAEIEYKLQWLNVNSDKRMEYMTMLIEINLMIGGNGLKSDF